MTGEKLIWYRLASHLGILVSELKERLTYTEFLEWCEFLHLEDNRKTKMDFYLAQIAAEVRRSFVTNPKQIRVVDFMIGEPTEDKVKKSKKAWALALKVDIGKN